MKLTGAKARGFLAKPDERFGCVLLHGANSIRVADQRSDLSMRLVGPDAAKDLRLTVLQAAQLTRKVGAIADALKAVGFFPGPRLVIVEGANDALHAQLGQGHRRSRGRRCLPRGNSWRLDHAVAREEAVRER